jgi:hypothetical protein
MVVGGDGLGRFIGNPALTGELKIPREDFLGALFANWRMEDALSLIRQSFRAFADRPDR